MKRLTKSMVLVAFLGAALAGNGLWAQVSGNPVDLTVNVNVPEILWISLSADTINFDPGTPSDPPNWELVAADENPVSVRTLAFVLPGTPVSLTVLANGNLISGTGDTIPISNITWTASGTGYVAGTMNGATPQASGSWTGFGYRTGQFNYFYQNDPQAPGNYTQTVTYTLATL